MNLSFSYAKYFYSNFYYGRPVASADGSTGEDGGCSVSYGTTFGSIRGGVTFTSNLGSTPSIGWVTSSWYVPSVVFARRASITYYAETCSATIYAHGSKLSLSTWMASRL